MRQRTLALLVPLALLWGLVVAAPPALAATAYRGALTPGVAAIGAVSVPGDDLLYTFAATSGQPLTFAVSSTDWGPDGGAALRFLRPDGSAFDFCIVTSTPKSCGFTPDVTGTWQLVIAPGDAAVGSATFSYVPDQANGPLTSGLPATVRITTPGQKATYTFAALKGVHVTFDVTATNWGDGGAVLSFRMPDGTLYDSCSIDIAALFCDFTPNITGTWQASFVPDDESVGAATFTYAADLAGGPLTAGTAVTTRITARGQDAGYTFAGIAGSHVVVEVSASSWGSDGDAWLYFFTPGGSLFSCGLAATALACEITPNSGGAWRAVLDPAGDSVGSVSFTYALDQRKGLLRPGALVTTTIATRGQNATYTLAGKRGTLVKLKITASNWGRGSARLFIFGPTGAALFSNCAVTAGSTCMFVPNRTGTWRLRLDPAGNSRGRTTLVRT